MNGSSFQRRLLSIQFDIGAAVIGLLLALALFPLRFVVSNIYINTLPIVLASACLLYLLAARNDTRRDELPVLSRPAQRALAPLVFVGLAALVVTAVLAGKRSILFYDIVGIVGTLLFAQIVFASEESFNRTRVLLQIVLLAAVVRLAALYTAPGLIGIDVWTHVTRLAHDIHVSGSLDAISDDKHYTSPLYHLLVVATSLLADVPLRLGLYLSLGLVMPLVGLFVFAASNLLVGERWAALAALLYTLSDYGITWGIHLIPTSMGLVLFMVVMYWLIRVMRTDYGAREFALLVAATVAVILTHQVSSFIMMVTLAAGIASYLLLQLQIFHTSKLNPDVFRARSPVNLLGLFVFNAGFSTFLWSMTPYRADSFLVTVLSYLQETIVSSAGVLNLAGPEGGGSGGGASAAPTFVETVATYVDVLGFLLLLFGTFVGCLYVVNRRRARQSTFLLLLSAAIMLVFVLGLPMFGIRNFIPTRWFAFLYVPLVLLTVIGLRYFALSLDRRLLIAILLVFALVFPSAMVMSSNGAIDNPVFENQEAKLSYNEAEIEAVYTIGEMTGSPDGDNLRLDQRLYTDHPYQTVFQRTRSYPATHTAVINDSEPVTHDMVVYRREQSRAATYFVNSLQTGEIRNIPQERLCRPSQATIYTNREVTMCINSPAT